MRKPILFAPAMHTEMWENAATQRNIATLKKDGHHFVGPSSGELAGGDVGPGRMSEPEEIVSRAQSILGGTGEGLTVLVTAGGTREAVDPVRYLGNRSSGKMGHAIADEAARRGYQVTLITTSDLPVSPSVKVVTVESAQEMQDAVAGVDAGIAVMAAAVADFRPVSPSDTKLSRSAGLEQLNLQPTPDILASVVARDPRPIVVGVAAETAGVDRAVAKAERKNVDLLVYNDISEQGSGFGTDTNRVVLIGRGGTAEELPQLPKTEVASRLWDRIGDLAAGRR
jgi:phosphopantothenoylcysteine decarboxylase/phosphopantothenate--cysteine ligase